MKVWQTYAEVALAWVALVMEVINTHTSLAVALVCLWLVIISIVWRTR